jgi:hypothetical protein
MIYIIAYLLCSLAYMAYSARTAPLMDDEGNYITPVAPSVKGIENIAA